MRILNGFLCVILALFTIVQYNDPDAILWIVIYGVPAVWAGVAAYRPNAVERNHLVGVRGRRDEARIGVARACERPEDGGAPRHERGRVREAVPRRLAGGAEP